ncbi:hypothetical protein TWF694_008972 [Orbilia ellipsospora]|uniref:Uncharacterized protein n=1 Tax=Orbilia ellipsospora TaxID=2528407 RepID=A0AAV9XDW6_9PEZI
MTHPTLAGPSGNITSPAQLCAKFDKGGGTGIQGGTFAIYSIASLGQTLDERLQKCPSLLTDLQQAASRVEETVPIYYKLSDIQEDKLHSLPSASSMNEDPNSKYPRLPWFLVNAAIAQHHCIVGQNSAVETLLSILRRPWCILEVCCTDYTTIEAVLEFSKLARQVNPELYAAAVLLLSHEAAKRSSETQIPLPPVSSSRAPEASLGPLREVYTALSADGMKSHNPFWLRVICVCGVQLGIAVSDLLRVLCAAKGVFIPENVGSPVRFGGLRRALTDDISSARRRISDHDQRVGFQSHSQRLISLYQKVLQQLTEEIP